MLSKYQGPVRRDREFGQMGYGGVMVWIANHISFKRRDDLDHPDIECLWLE